MQFAPQNNGKQEAFWNPIEGRLLPMLEGVADLTLQVINHATLAWLEVEYNRSLHSELGMSPLQRYLQRKDVGRPCPPTAELQLAFTAEVGRTLRRSDGTISLAARRFEVPSRYAHLARLTVRFASWDLSQVYLADPTTGALLCRLYPQDKQRNADGHRAPKDSPLEPSTTAPAAAPGMAPLLQKILHQYATTGLPPAYLPKDELSTPPSPA